MIVYTLPIIGALIGWLTNYLAVKMLFHPRLPKKFVFFTLQGVFPKRQKDLAKKLGQIVSDELFSASDVKEIISKNANSPQVHRLLEEKFDVLLNKTLPGAIPMIAMMLTPELIGMLRGIFVREMESMITGAVDDLSAAIEHDMDIHEIVEEKVANFSSDKLESLIFTIMRKELRFIEYIGGLLGFLIGCIQVVLVKWNEIWPALTQVYENTVGS